MMMPLVLAHWRMLCDGASRTLTPDATSLLPPSPSNFILSEPLLGKVRGAK
jgi:hypothetical protein